MPADFLAEILFRFVFELVVYGVGYLTGAVFVPVFSFGAYRVEEVARPVRGKRRKRRPRSQPQPPRTVSADTAALIGLLFWTFVIVIGWLALRQTHS